MATKKLTDVQEVKEISYKDIAINLWFLLENISTIPTPPIHTDFYFDVMMIVEARKNYFRLNNGTFTLAPHIAITSEERFKCQMK